ncbi:MAG: hypothetical protein ACYTGX_04690 [Planctomycetota bacterium]|jgi:hypothetical protein
MAGFINKERVVFAGAVVYAAMKVMTLLQGSAELPKIPRKPSYKTPEEPSTKPLPALTEKFTRWNVERRNVFMPRQEFSDLPPAVLPVPPAPKANVVSAVPSPRPAAGAAGKFRSPVSGATLNLEARPAPEEDDE